MAEPEIHRFSQVASTLDVIHEFAGRGAPHGTVVVAEEQLAGRGSRGRTWHSPLGGLWYSILLRGGAADEALSLQVGLAVVDAVEAMVPEASLALKWPNDLMLGERKVGGVLCEARWQGAVLAWIAVGLGLNVRNQLPDDVVPGAVALNSVLPPLHPDSLVGPITRALRAMHRDGAGLSAGDLGRFEKRDWLRGREVIEPVEGIADGVEKDGRLRVRGKDGELTCLRSGSVVVGGRA
jgi:BirA family biotin operon repressor/biotin-[acetyl-CoA-carboxylase] ligase